ncbi:di-N-acetylchitobiase-like [Heterodontus francisci]|uniref:di-N-acetylchitobiase-like n=1 Tax=Heterodontus francisci TaxID=7792 RepID=UPI00355BC9B9
MRALQISLILIPDASHRITYDSISSEPPINMLRLTTQVKASDQNIRFRLCLLYCINDAAEYKLLFLHYLSEEINIQKLTDSAYNNKWLAGILDRIKALHLDGIHLEQWDVVAKESAKYHALSQLTNKTVQTFHREIPGSQVTFNVPWSPDCKDGRCFNYAAIANSCDFLFVSAFDMNSQMWDECFAKPNSPYHKTLSGLYAYINLGIDSRKLVMGIPWYGYDFPCLRFYEPGRCELQKSPFRGAPCSAKVGRQTTYKDIMQLLPRSITGRYWDDDYKSPYYVYRVNNKYHEVWYDDPESISLKSSILKKLKLRGIGMWAANYLNYTTDPTVAMQTEQMWNALCPVPGKWRT